MTTPARKGVTLEGDAAVAREALRDEIYPPERTRHIMTIRERLEIPENGPKLRAWLRYQLQHITNPKTGQAWTQADISRAAGGASGSAVSRVFMGELRLTGGSISDEIRKVTARVLDLPTDVIWPPLVCPSCGWVIGAENNGHLNRTPLTRVGVRGVSTTTAK